MNLGNMKLAELSQEIRTALADTGPGQPTQPFFSAAGIEIMVRCDRAAPQVTAFQMPSHQQIEEQLYEQQMSVLARRYMRDLRRDADVETRDETKAEDVHATIN
jgi:peptidyl-prolyl cis-trans isomerase SurA